MSWPNTQEKKRGDFVRNVHPLNVGRYPDGVVLHVEPDYPNTLSGSVSVAIGRGSHVYGPAAHWEVIEDAPEWYETLTGGDDAA